MSLPPEFWPFLTVVMIDIVLAGDNAVVVGMAAAGLPARERARAIAVGIAAATILRIAFALVAVELLAVIGLLLAGGILLLWVSWKLWRELEEDRRRRRRESAVPGAGAEEAAREHAPKTLRQAIVQIILADISMSLDNVLAVAGAAHEHPYVMAAGLVLSVALMGLAAGIVAGLLQKYRWIAYVGLLVIVYVALDMIWEGANEVAAAAASMF